MVPLRAPERIEHRAAGYILPALRAPTGTVDSPPLHALAVEASALLLGRLGSVPTGVTYWRTFCARHGLPAEPSVFRDINDRNWALFTLWLSKQPKRGDPTTPIAPSSVATYKSQVASDLALYSVGGRPFTQRGLHTAIHSRVADKSTAVPRLRMPVTPPFFGALRELKCPAFVYCAIVTAFLFMLRAGEYSRSGSKAGWALRVMKRRDVVVTDACVTITMRVRKNNKRGYAHVLIRNASSDPAVCPVAHMRTMLASPGAPDDFLFRDPTTGSLLTRDRVAHWLRRAAQHLGLDPAIYSTHSLRIGGASAAWKAHMSIVWIMQQGYWKTLGGVLPYLRRIGAGDDGKATDVFMGLCPAYGSPCAQNRDLDANLQLMEQERARRPPGDGPDDEPSSEDELFEL